MKIPKEFKGRIYFLLDAKYGYLTAHHDDVLNEHPDYIYLGCTDDLHITFDTGAATEKAVEAINKAIEKERAQSHARIQALTDQRNSLLALEHIA